MNRTENNLIILMKIKHCKILYIRIDFCMVMTQDPVQFCHHGNKLHKSYISLQINAVFVNININPKLKK